MTTQAQNKKAGGARVPALRFPEFSDEWDEKKLMDLCSIKTGKKDVNEGNPNGKYPFFTCARTNTYSNEYSFDGDAILIAGNGEVGNCQFYSGKFEAYQRTYVLQNFSVEVKYLFLYLGHSFQTLVSKQKQMGAMPYIKLGMLTDFHVCLPAAEEQQKIAEFLGAVDEKIEQLSKKKSSIERYKKGVMQRIFSQEIRFKPARNASRSDAGGDENGNSYPDWEEKRLGEVAEVIMGQSPESDSYNADGIGKYLIQGNADIRGRETFPRNWTIKPTKECELGDVIMTVRAPVGYIAKSLHNACIGRGVCAIRSKKGNKTDFLYQFLVFFEKRWIKFEQGSTFTAVNTNDVKKLKLQIPSKEEQQKIADLLTGLDEKISAISSELDRVKDFKKGLLQQMFV